LQPHKHTNLLSQETSPYLLQHQHNPVDWYPWGEKAFEASRRENKPIFLSVGYSTCYWCHVMERQSFEVESIAQEMNQRFINIKVDREERPDVDQLYMTAVQILTRHGGWPMSVFLTPDLRPFYGGTYFPPTDQHGRPGFVTLIRALEDAYKNRRNDVDQTASQIVDMLKQLAEPAPPAQPIPFDDDLAERLLQRSIADYDSINGGFGSAPKFPRQTLLELLLVHNRYFPNQKHLAMVTHTLDALAFGGIRDQLGGAFHRYSTDAEWLVPHFEIMLYDNAMLAWCYVEAFQQTREARYAAIARGIFDFTLREMTSPQGAFYTAFDAEVDAQEGRSYLWTRAEVEATLAQALGTEPAAEASLARFCRVYGLDQGPNFSDPHQNNGRPEKNILFLAEPDNGSALLDPELKPLREILYAERSKRKQPLLDTKIITSWNALMIRAFAFGGQVLQEPTYVRAATKAADFLLTNHRTQDGGLYRTSRDGVTKYAGFLDDYAFLIQSLLALHTAAGDPRWKETAQDLSEIMIRKFGDPDHGGFYFTEDGATDLIVRQKVASDSPLPSGNAIAALALLSLNQPEITRRTIAAFAGQLPVNSEGMSAMLQALVVYLREHPPFIVSADDDGPGLDRPATPEQAASEIVSITTAWASEQILNVGVSVSTGFHINAHKPSAGMLPTQLLVNSDVPSAINFPPPEHRQFEFSGEPIDVFSDNFTIVVRFTGPLPASSTIRLALKYQACDNHSCLPPVTTPFEVSVPRFRGR
jgi:uncharacterized protein YyaL (SSP411 family)